MGLVASLAVRANLEKIAAQAKGMMICPCDTHDEENLLERIYDRIVKQGSNISMLLDPSACSSIWIGALVSGRDETKLKRYTPRGHSSDQRKRNWADRWRCRSRVGSIVKTPHD